MLYPMELLYLFLGLFIGALCAWLIAYYQFVASGNRLPEQTVREKYILREIFDNLQAQSDLNRDDLLDKEKEIRELERNLATASQQVRHLEEKLELQQAEVSKLQERFQTEFENIANRLLEEKSLKFTNQNQQQLGELLNPLREKIKDFESGMEKKFIEETKDRSALKKEIEYLRELNTQLSKDANNLVLALKGDNKAQGDWGELQLERVLEKSGLTKGIHFVTQASFRDEEGQHKRPDFIIHLPENKHLIIDCKVSLVAYEQYFNENDAELRKKFLRSHIESLRNHIRDLGSKNYQELYQINSPDYLLLFVPLEHALNSALQEDSKLFNEALDKNIVLVTTSTLLATMRTVSFIWKQEKQKNNVLEIARQSGKLYDKFCGFVDDLKDIGNRLDAAQSSYHHAMQKMVNSSKFGDTLIGRAEKIRELGAKTSKKLPQEMLDISATEEADSGQLPG